MGSTVNTERHGKVMLIELARPEAMNAVDPIMKRELPAALAEAGRDYEIGAVVLTAAGSRAFCTGSDLKAGSGSDDPSIRRTARSLLYDYQPVLDLITRMDKPVIAAVNGAAAGVGMSMVLASDLVVMSSGSYLMSPFMNIGLVPDGGAAWFLIRKLGHARGFEAIAEAQKLSAQQCLDYGLVNRVVEPEQVRANALEWATQLAARAPVAMALSKRLARLSQTTGLAEYLALEAEMQTLCAATQDAREAIAAFAEKRTPNFTGR